MKVTHEMAGSTTLIYVYIRLFNGRRVETLSGVKCELLYDGENNWIGMKVFNECFDGEKLVLPKVMMKMPAAENESIVQYDDFITLMFDRTRKVSSSRMEDCNIDFNDDGFFGAELILDKEIGCLDAIKNVVRR